MFGRRESLRELIRSQHSSLQELIRNEQEKTREFEREILLRNEMVYTSVIAEMERNGEQIAANTKQIRESTEQTRAETQAILKLLDRFDDPGAATA